ncbi:hypothetical protein FRX31_015121, partial [Thalictrum thalictroides]
VYESNHGSTVRAGLVQGTCEVLPPNKFKEESERRIHSDNGSQPLFLCKLALVILKCIAGSGNIYQKGSLKW